MTFVLEGSLHISVLETHPFTVFPSLFPIRAAGGLESRQVRQCPEQEAHSHPHVEGMWAQRERASANSQSFCHDVSQHHHDQTKS